MSGKAKDGLARKAWKWAWRRLGWKIPDCGRCGDTGWISKETWVGPRGFRTAERCDCGAPHLRFL